jgi:hypothetical protein
MTRQPIPRDLQARIASDIGDYVDLIARRAEQSRSTVRGAEHANNVPARNDGD